MALPQEQGKNPERYNHYANFKFLFELGEPQMSKSLFSNNFMQGFDECVSEKRQTIRWQSELRPNKVRLKYARQRDHF